MVFSITKRVVMFVPNKWITVNKNVNRVINLSKYTDKTFTYVAMFVQVVGGTAKGSVDLAEAVAYYDDVCAFVSAVGIAVNGLKICT